MEFLEVTYRRFLWNQKDKHDTDDITIQEVIINTIIKYINYFNCRKIQDRRYSWLSTNDKYKNNSKNWYQKYVNAMFILKHGKEFINVDLQAPEE